MKRIFSFEANLKIFRCDHPGSGRMKLITINRINSYPSYLRLELIF